MVVLRRRNKPAPDKPEIPVRIAGSLARPGSAAGDVKQSAFPANFEPPPDVPKAVSSAGGADGTPPSAPPAAKEPTASERLSSASCSEPPKSAGTPETLAAETPDVPALSLPDGRDGLRRRLDELRHAEAMHRAMLEANMQPEPPKLTDWDRQFLEQRPNILQNKDFHALVNSMLQHGIRHGDPRWNEILEKSFPLQTEQSTPRTPEPEPPPPPPPREPPPMPQYTAQTRTNGIPRATTSADFPTKRQRDEALLMEAHEEQNRQARSPGYVVSAPPHREPVSVATGRPTNSRVTLSPLEREIAHAAGQTEAEYAAGKLQLERRRQAGLLQD